MNVIVDYDLGNLKSIGNMIEHLGYEYEISGENSTIEKATKLFLPGVGAFDNGMRALNSKNIRESLTKAVVKYKVPILGICLGMQLMTRGSEEGILPGLSWIDAEVVRFKFSKESDLKIPHMGWSEVKIVKPNPILSNPEQNSRFYFSHSYKINLIDKELCIGNTDYGGEFCAALQKENMFGVQFHPEKSHRFGMSLIKKFLDM